MIEAGIFAIFGDWDDAPTPEGMIRISLPPLGHVYGGGWQPYTQAALDAINQYLLPGMTFADIGTGSGILSVAASKLGASRVIATELDRDALAVAQRTFEINGVVGEIVDGTFPEEEVDLAVLCISSDFALEYRDKVKAKKVICIMDDASVEVYDGA